VIKVDIIGIKYQYKRFPSFEVVWYGMVRRGILKYTSNCAFDEDIALELIGF